MNNNGLAHFSISNNGSLAFIPGNINNSVSILALVNSNGVSKPLSIPASQSPQLSPDGKQVLFERTQGLANLWIYEFERNILRRIADKEYETFGVSGHLMGKGLYSIQIYRAVLHVPYAGRWRMVLDQQ